ncbi:hypothetical protein PFISCL1PPCAC_8749, partial [Pristionchus fissidentatus]
TIMLKPLLILATIVCSSVLLYSTLVADEDTAAQRQTIYTSTHVSFTLSDQWLRFFDSFEFAVPVIIIDNDLLGSILVGGKWDNSSRIVVAVEERYRNATITHSKRELEVVYYSKTRPDRDYWLFKRDNDTRTMLPFDLSSSSLVFWPTDVHTFLNDWNFSRFMECEVQLKRNDTGTRSIPLSFLSEMAKLRDFIKERKARLTLAGGSLLGWYRECSIIPHTTDIDFFIRAEEYSPAIKADLDDKKSPYKLFRIYGTPTDSYELSLNVKKAKAVNIDLFFLYTNKNESFVGGLAWYTRKKYKWSYPRITELCTADLLGHLFYVPCNTGDVLDMEYGDWRKDSASANFVWYKSHSNVKENGQFSKEEMKTMRAFG